MDCPAPPELGEVRLGRLLVRHLDVCGRDDVRGGLEHPEPVCGERERELVAPALVAEPVEASEVVRDGGVEGEVREREEARGRPEVSALEARWRGGGDAREDERQEEEEGEEEAPQLLLLRVGGALLLHRLVEVQLHHRAQRLRRRLAGDHVDDGAGPGGGSGAGVGDVGRLAHRHGLPDPGAVVQIHGASPAGVCLRQMHGTVQAARRGSFLAWLPSGGGGRSGNGSGSGRGDRGGKG